MADTAGFLRGRMDRSYQETWAVALVVGLNALVLGHKASLAPVLGTGTATWAVVIIGGLATLFVWSRHGIYSTTRAWSRSAQPTTPTSQSRRRRASSGQDESWRCGRAWSSTRSSRWA